MMLKSSSLTSIMLITIIAIDIRAITMSIKKSFYYSL